MIILERDGSISHNPPDLFEGESRWARVAISADVADGHTEPSVIERILSFTFDVLGVSNLEVQVYEHQER